MPQQKDTVGRILPLLFFFWKNKVKIEESSIFKILKTTKLEDSFDLSELRLTVNIFTNPDLDVEKALSIKSWEKVGAPPDKEKEQPKEKKEEEPKEETDLGEGLDALFG